MQERQQHVTAGQQVPTLTRAHRVLIAVVVLGVIVISAIGFAGSYSAVRQLAQEHGFGRFSAIFPIGIDAGICVLLSLDLLLTWLRIPLPLLRQVAWLLTVATIVFNAAASWGDPLGVAMHAAIPLLFVGPIEAGRHAIGRIADITADRHMEGVRRSRWMLSPLPTFKLWRSMKLWEIRSYKDAVRLEQHRLVYEAMLHRDYGDDWRKTAPVDMLLPLRLARYGIPLSETAPEVLLAAGLELGQPGAPSESGRPTDERSERSRQDTGADAMTEATDAPDAEHARPGEWPTDAPAMTDPVADPVADDPVAEVTGHVAMTDPVESPSGAAMTDPAVPIGHEGFPRPTAPLSDWLAEPVTPPQPHSGPATVPAGSATGHDARDRWPEQPMADVSPSPESVTARAPEAPPGEWPASVTDTGAATARVPEQQTQEADADPEKERIVMVAGWVAEAEDAGEKLTGAEVARRLDVSPRTGQRVLTRAKELRDEEQRQQPRPRLRSVGDRS
ncbi:DUF2637 domain-containing protein [Streptomyces sp. NPDC021100]|uniref:DUF2637 domain-containing protein n=1 Tax=Streptomyces sp. NPDC021100 TaxID=3365114 RepID=UPI0037AFEE2C